MVYRGDVSVQGGQCMHAQERGGLYVIPGSQPDVHVSSVCVHEVQHGVPAVKNASTVESVVPSFNTKITDTACADGVCGQLDPVDMHTVVGVCVPDRSPAEGTGPTRSVCVPDRSPAEGTGPTGVVRAPDRFPAERTGPTGVVSGVTDRSPAMGTGPTEGVC